MVCAYRARASKAARPLFVDPWAEAIAGPDGDAIARRLDARFPPMELWLTLLVAYLDRMVALAGDPPRARPRSALAPRVRLRRQEARGRPEPVRIGRGDAQLCRRARRAHPVRLRRHLAAPRVVRVCLGALARLQRARARDDR